MARYSRSKILAALRSLGYAVSEERHSYTALRNAAGDVVKLPVELVLDRKAATEVAKQAGCSLAQLSIRVASLASRS
jgi:hypothetical protein